MNKKILVVIFVLISLIILATIFIIDNGENIIEYYDSGEIKAKYSVKDGILDGNYSSYYISGKVKSKGLIKEGLNEGLWSYFLENGSLKSIGNYDKGNRIGQWYYKDSTKIITWNTFTDENNRIRINYPKGWEINTTNKILMIICNNPKNNNSFNISSDTIDLTLDPYIDKYFSDMRNQILDYEFNIIHQQENVKGRTKAILYDASNGNNKYRVLCYFIKDNNRFLVLSFYTLTGNVEDYLYMYDEIMNSIKLL